MEKLKIVLITVITIAIISFIAYAFDHESPSYGRRGQQCWIGGVSTGFILCETNPNSWKSRKYVHVLYVNALGSWEERAFPSQLVSQVPPIITVTP